MKRILIAGASLLAVLGVSGVPALAHEIDDDDKKREIVKTYDLSGFDKIEVEGVYLLDVQVGEDFSVLTKASKKEAPDVRVSVSGRTLVLGTREGGKKRNRNNGVRAVVTLPSLTALSAAGIATGDVTGIDAEKFSIDVAGIADLDLVGRCDRLKVDVAGIGRTDASKLRCDEVDAELGGMGELSVYASERVDAEMSGMGKIEVHGNPPERKTEDGFFNTISFVD